MRKCAPVVVQEDEDVGSPVGPSERAETRGECEAGGKNWMSGTRNRSRSMFCVARA